jgi:hypothetical protein
MNKFKCWFRIWKCLVIWIVKIQLFDLVKYSIWFDTIDLSWLILKFYSDNWIRFFKLDIQSWFCKREFNWKKSVRHKNSITETFSNQSLPQFNNGSEFTQLTTRSKSVSINSRIRISLSLHSDLDPSQFTAGSKSVTLFSRRQLYHRSVRPDGSLADHRIRRLQSGNNAIKTFGFCNSWFGRR